MTGILLENVVKKSNIAYLKEMTNSLNYLFGSIVEKIIFCSLFGDKYKYYSDFVNPKIIDLIKEINNLNEYQKYFLLIMFNFLSTANEDKKHKIIYFSINAVCSKEDKFKDYLFLLFNYNHFIDNVKCVIELKEEDKELLKKLFNKITKIVFCNEQEYIENNINILKGYIDIDNVLLLSDNHIEIVTRDDFTNKYVRSSGIHMEQDKTLLPIIDCFENANSKFGLRVFK